VSNLRPMLEEGADPLATLLLEEAREVRSSEARIQKLMATLTDPAFVGAATTGTALTASKAGIATGTARLFAKWLAVGAVGSASVVGVGTWLMSSRPAASEGPLLPSISSSRAYASQSSPRADETEVPRSPPAAESVAASSAARSRPPSTQSGAAPLPPADSSGAMSLAAEVALIDRARSALDRHDPKGALATLDEYNREAPGGRLWPEACYLRVAALLAAGHRRAAEDIGRRFLATDSSSSHASQIRALLWPNAPTKNP